MHNVYILHITRYTCKMDYNSSVGIDVSQLLNEVKVQYSECEWHDTGSLQSTARVVLVLHEPPVGNVPGRSDEQVARIVNTPAKGLQHMYTSE